MPPTQLNLRIAPQDRAVLEALAFLAGSTPSDLARRWVLEQIEQQGRSHRVAELLRLREEAAAEVAGRLVDLARDAMG